jgi:hypothetical protein
MPSRRSLDAMERDAKAADLYRQGQSYRQIAREMGWRSSRSAVEAVHRAARDAMRDKTGDAEAFQLLLERIQDRRRMACEALETPCYVTSASGKVVLHPDTDEPLIDISPVFRALAELRHDDDMEAKLRGLYAPVKTQVRVITEEDLDAEMARLTAENAERERRLAISDHPGTAREDPPSR